ncbi:MAG: hypothetical protein HYY16_07110 [Planctomycetes bacterium]|nr:hypothetical protein [Planctomycetota bacterium]
MGEGSNHDVILALLQMADSDERSIAFCDEVIEQCEKLEEPAAAELVGGAYHHKVRVLVQMGRAPEALAACDDMVRLFGGRAGPVWLRQVAAVLLTKGNLAAARPQGAEQAIRAFDEVIGRLDRAADGPELTARAASAYVHKAACLGEMNRTAEAMEVLRAVQERFSVDPAAEVQYWVAEALLQQGQMLGKAGRAAESIQAYREVCRRTGKADVPALRGQAAQACLMLLRAGEEEEALDDLTSILEEMSLGDLSSTSCDDILGVLGSREHPKAKRAAAQALYHKAHAREGPVLFSNRIRALEDLVERFGREGDPGVLRVVGQALMAKAANYGLMGQNEQAAATYAEIVVRFGQASDVSLRACAAEALVSKGVTLESAGEGARARACYEEVVRAFGGETDERIREQVGKATRLMKRP